MTKASPGAPPRLGATYCTWGCVALTACLSLSCASAQLAPSRRLPPAPIPKVSPAHAPVPPASVTPPPAPPQAAHLAPSPQALLAAHKLCERGLSFFHRGDYDTAERQAKAALRVWPQAPEALVLLGRVYLMEGVVQADRALMLQAKGLLEAALQLDPQAREAKDLLQLFVPPPP